MGPRARSAAIIRVFAAFLAAAAPALALAAATAHDVALNASAGCTNGNLDITLTTVGANREAWRATNLAGSTLTQNETFTGLSNFSGVSTGFQLVFSPSQPADTLIASYVYVGEAPPDASNTAEFFVLYNCSTREVLRKCVGPYGSCPQTAQQAVQQAGLSSVSPIPALGAWPLAALSLLLAALGGLARTRRS